MISPNRYFHNDGLIMTLVFLIKTQLFRNCTKNLKLTFNFNFKQFAWIYYHLGSDKCIPRPASKKFGNGLKKERYSEEID